jgi:D-alanine-D-alanine ligase
MTSDGLRVAVLCGGPSREHGVSLRTGAAVARALDDSGHHVLPVRIERDGRWRLETDVRRLETEAPGGGPPATSATTTLSLLEDAESTSRVDVVFVALHGPFGEDGTIQGLLEAAGIPYTGSGVAASALAMDKERTKEVVLYHGIGTPPWVGVTRARWERDREAILAAVGEGPGFPAVVKPARDGSSFGVSLAADAARLTPALDAALEDAEGRALVERRIDGTELSCPVLGNRHAEKRPLPVVEIVPRGREFFDFAAKYQGASEEVCPARIPDDVAARVQELSLRVHELLGCDGLSRSDFILDEAGELWFLETNTVPGLTPESLSPLSAREAGMSFPQLCDVMTRLALQPKRPR